MEWSRGCIFKCAFCTYPILGVRDDHSRDENDLYEEMIENYERWGTKYYALADETVNDYHEKLERYAKVIKIFLWSTYPSSTSSFPLISGSTTIASLL